SQGSRRSPAPCAVPTNCVLFARCIVSSPPCARAGSLLAGAHFPSPGSRGPASLLGGFLTRTTRTTRTTAAGAADLSELGRPPAVWCSSAKDAKRLPLEKHQ